MTGHDEYERLTFEARKFYLSHFFLLLQHLPISYRTFLYKRSEFSGRDEFVLRMRQDITNLLFDNLRFFQSFDIVKVYYDDGQQIVVRALRAAVEYVLSTNSFLYRKTRASDFVLEQAADMLCTLELTAHKFACKETTRTDEKFFGSERNFKRNYLKKIRRKLLTE